ncbi:hypothetical protein CSAL01_03179 [Colletotrichum salicis]|uniref:Uncharacterized protein n=1 Tax=Colletotrichum salicis TaxID=1209931 RepID=A0A135U8P1_9PEZI|nr:hypothetical protein CSAL01_03179 [Colletotrichum salicis]
MEFSFPLRIWCSSPVLMRDRREETSSGQRLRSSRDVKFLRQLAPTEKLGGATTDGIYSGHISAMVTGYDQFRWTGLALVEDWFETSSDDPGPDSLERYENDFEDGVLSDPLARGKVDVAGSSWDPRPYFVHILQVRLTQVHREWVFLLSKIDGILTRTVRESRS